LQGQDVLVMSFCKNWPQTLTTWCSAFHTFLCGLGGTARRGLWEQPPCRIKFSSCWALTKHIQMTVVESRFMKPVVQQRYLFLPIWSQGVPRTLPPPPAWTGIAEIESRW